MVVKNKEFISRLTGLLAVLPNESGHDVIDYLLISARLAATVGGSAAPFKEWPTRLFALKDKLPAFSIRNALLSRVESALWDYDHAYGEPLAGAVIAAEDAHCFSTLAATLTPDAFAAEFPETDREIFACWVDAAEETVLDGEAVIHIEDWRDMSPVVDDDLRLGVVERPLTAMETVVASLPCFTEPYRVAEFIPDEGLAVEHLVAADTGRYSEEPPDGLREFFRLNRRFLCEPAAFACSGDLATREITFKRYLDSDWHLVMELEREDGTPLPVDKIILSCYAGVQREESPGKVHFSVDLRRYPNSLDTMAAFRNAHIFIRFETRRWARLKL